MPVWWILFRSPAQCPATSNFFGKYIGLKSPRRRLRILAEKKQDLLLHYSWYSFNMFQPNLKEYARQFGSLLPNFGVNTFQQKISLKPPIIEALPVPSQKTNSKIK